MIPKYELINYNDKLYYVYRRIPERPGKEGMINDIKEFWMCDLVLKNKNDNTNILIFLREIPDAILVDD